MLFCKVWIYLESKRKYFLTTQKSLHSFDAGVDWHASTTVQSEQSQNVQSLEPEKALKSIIGIGQADFR